MTQMNLRGSLQIAARHRQSVETEALPGTGLDSTALWSNSTSEARASAPATKKARFNKVVSIPRGSLQNSE